MTINDWLIQSQHQLEVADIPTARLDALVLLADILEKDKSWLLSHSDYVLQGSILKKLNTNIIQRAKHLPLAYIRGHCEFYGRDFLVNPNTLVPRPETETIIEVLLTLNLPNETRLLDIGTGSGCIAITAALELPSARVSACDIDPTCLEVARQNAINLNAHVAFFKSNLLDEATPQEALLANLPYVPEDFHINIAATHEPQHAIFGGSDGLNVYRELFEQVSNKTWQPKYVLTESLPLQHAELAKIARRAGFVLQTTNDFIQLFSHR